jgi:uncharacterized protein YeaO (DUF488 family)
MADLSTTEDRLRQRGLTKDRAALDLWLKQVAPSTELRKWFGHDPARWEQFQGATGKNWKRKSRPAGLLMLKGKQGTVTLIYAARDDEHNGALPRKRMKH